MYVLVKISHSLIKIPKVKVDEKQVPLNNLLKSNLLSGGIENRFLNEFSKETATAIEHVAVIENDTTLLNYVTKSEFTEEDNILISIAQKGMDETVDQLLELFQWNLVKLRFCFKVGGDSGMALTRCAFAVMVKFNRLTPIFEICINQFEISLSEVEGDSQNAKYNELLKELKSACDLDKLLAIWELASQMRVWLQGKKKTISITIKDEALKRFDEEQTLAAIEENKTLPEDDKIEEEKIVTSKKEAEMVETKVKFESIYTDEHLLSLELKQQDELVDSIFKKTQFLLKMSLPKVWDETNKENNYLMLDPMTGESEIDMDSKFLNLGNKLKSFRKIQSSRGTIKNYEEIDSKEIFNSTGTSILAFLQCSLALNDIQNKLEERYIKALNRFWGFKIMSEVAICYMTDSYKVFVFTWFCSALRNNQHLITHFTNGLRGMGEHLLTKSRLEFSKILAGIVKQIRQTSQKDIVISLFSALYWRIYAGDQEFFIRTGIMELLKDGNNKNMLSENPIKHHWGHDAGLKLCTKDSPTLSFVITDYLEFVTSQCLGRVLSKSKEHVSLSSGSKNQGNAKIQKAFSKVNTEALEVLLSKITDILFAQVKRYSNNWEQGDTYYKQGLPDHQRVIKSGFKSPNYKYVNGVYLFDEPGDDAITTNQEDYGNKLPVRKRMVEQKEYLKLQKMYSPEIVTKILKMIEMILCVSLNKQELHEFILKLFKEDILYYLIITMFKSNYQHFLLIIRILGDLLTIGLDSEPLEKAAERVLKLDSFDSYNTYSTSVKINKSALVKLVVLRILRCRETQFTKKAYTSDGEHYISNRLISFIKAIVISKNGSLWREQLSTIAHEFLKSINSYSLHEIDALLCIFGADTESYSYGFNGKVDENTTVTIAGFNEFWHKIKQPPNADYSFTLPAHYCTLGLMRSTQSALVMKMVKEGEDIKRKIELISLKDLNLTPVDQTGIRLDFDVSLIMGILDQINTTSNEVNLNLLLTKTLILKFLSRQLLQSSDSGFKLDSEDKMKLLKYCLNENQNTKPQNMEHRDYFAHEMRLNELKRYASENYCSLVPNPSAPRILFNISKNEKDSVTPNKVSFGVQVENKETGLITYVVNVKRAFNTQLLYQNTSYMLFANFKEVPSSMTRDSVTLIDAADCENIDVLRESIEHTDIFITTDFNLINIRDILDNIGPEFVIEKVYLVISEEDYNLLKSLSELNQENTEIPAIGKIDIKKEFVNELSTYAKVSKSYIEKVIIDNKDDRLDKIVKIYSDNNSKFDPAQYPIVEEQKNEENKVEEHNQHSQMEKSNMSDIMMSNYNIQNMFGLKAIGNFTEALNKFNQAGEIKANTKSTSKTLDIFKEVFNINEQAIQQSYIDCLTIN